MNRKNAKEIEIQSGKKFYLFQKEEMNELLNNVKLLVVEIESKMLGKNLGIESKEAKAEIKFGSDFLN